MVSQQWRNRLPLPPLHFFMSVEFVAPFRDAFRAAFREYIRDGDRMAELLRSAAENCSGDVREAIQAQQILLTASQECYETARSRYVTAVMQQMPVASNTLS